MLDLTCAVPGFLNANITDDQLNLIVTANILIVIKIQSVVQPYIRPFVPKWTNLKIKPPELYSGSGSS